MTLGEKHTWHSETASIGRLIWSGRLPRISLDLHSQVTSTKGGPPKTMPVGAHIVVLVKGRVTAVTVSLCLSSWPQRWQNVELAEMTGIVSEKVKHMALRSPE